MLKRLLVPPLALGIAALAIPAVPAAAQEPALTVTPLGTYESGAFAAGAAEIVAYDPLTQRVFTVNAEAAVVDVLDVADPAAPVKAFSIDAADAIGVDGAVANSVAVQGDLVAVAVEAPDKTGAGWVALFDTEGAFLDRVEVGSLPDSLAFSPGGRYIVVANEGEPSEDYAVDPDGTVSVIDAETHEVRTADFEAYASGAKDLPEGFRVFGPDPEDVAAGIEPEYVAMPDDATAYVTLQENNAIAVVDLASAAVVDVHALGTKDHSAPGNELDASDKDDAVSIGSWPVQGLYLPDTIATYEAGGETFLVTANEGDVREWGEYSEEARVEDLELCADAFAGYDLAELQSKEALGRLKVTSTLGQTEAGCYDGLYSFGGRSFSIWSADGELVFDSGSDFETLLAADYAEFFNADNESNDFDDRSDDKGPEPEAVAVGAVGDRTYAFIGLERQGGVMVYDVTDPAASVFVDYVTARDFAVAPGEGDAGDLGPESIKFVAAADSPTGRAMIVVGNEISGTTTLYDVADGLAGDGEDPSESESGGEALPETGSGATGLLVGAAAVLAVAGGALILMRRRAA
ncbi:choice-of-anchor I family protein [Glycomyces paridis]|uniref:LPXTG cell wall anchor domain-containing protein n=1 Tax=Glycomyces paridis TaxID=2126555 RepID=A0A4S8PCM8_9ACTN|nr:choice-of-anchor I family protein [Glycomyces paridis]THV27541.1 LPXTG cell wall anchor domain-containing protein [Glycomyces paridis]